MIPSIQMTWWFIIKHHLQFSHFPFLPPLLLLLLLTFFSLNMWCQDLYKYFFIIFVFSRVVCECLWVKVYKHKMKENLANDRQFAWIMCVQIHSTWNVILSPFVHNIVCVCVFLLIYWDSVYMSFEIIETNLANGSREIQFVESNK
jgi:hypothetical protein